ncbi:(2Fe-2S) ferredoxin domain-containing protein [Clostridium oceanicum]|uniref:NAD(P)H-dependent oxidoreductase subunit E n=1 Tax=Clostridium oceanicum TaxID=1543 RepID=A0ABP3UVK3_9CLOT
MITINVCVGSACHLKGSYKVISSFKKMISDKDLENKIEIKGAFCLGHCTEAVSVKVEDKIYSVNESNVDKFFHDVILGKLKENE